MKLIKLPSFVWTLEHLKKKIAFDRSEVILLIKFLKNYLTNKRKWLNHFINKFSYLQNSKSQKWYYNFKWLAEKGIGRVPNFAIWSILKRLWKKSREKQYMNTNI